jgi:glutathione S-transferase
MGVLFNTNLTPEVKAAALSRLDAKLKFMEEHELSGKTKFMMGETITVADLYAAVVLSWGEYLNVDVGKYPKVAAYMKAVFAEPKVAAAQASMMKAAGQS